MAANSLILPNLSITQPESGEVNAMKSPGIVRTSFVKVSAEALSGNALVISGKEGAIVAPAITVIMLQNKMVIFTSLFLFMRQWLTAKEPTTLLISSECVRQMYKPNRSRKTVGVIER